MNVCNVFWVNALIAQVNRDRRIYAFAVVWMVTFPRGYLPAPRPLLPQPL